LSATTLLARVVEKNGLSEDPAFAIPGEGQEALLRRFSERVEIGLRRGTRIIDLAVEDTDPARAKRLVEFLVSEYEAWTTERQQAITRQASDGLAREEERLKGKMELSARRLQEFRENNPAPGLDGGENPGVVRDQMAVLGDQLA